MDSEDSRWIFKKNAADVSLLLTPLNGKVFELVKQSKDKKKQQKATPTDTTKMLDAPPPKAKKAAKAKPKGQKKSSAPVEIDDPTAADDQITVNTPEGDMVSRVKYFLDCLIHGAPSSGVMRKAEPDVGFVDTAGSVVPFVMTYYEVEWPIVRQLVRKGFAFVFQGEEVIDGKLHKRYSSFRPALQSHALQLYKNVA